MENVATLDEGYVGNVFVIGVLAGAALATVTTFIVLSLLGRVASIWNICKRPVRGASPYNDGILAPVRASLPQALGDRGHIAASEHQNHHDGPQDSSKPEQSSTSQQSPPQMQACEIKPLAPQQTIVGKETYSASPRFQHLASQNGDCDKYLVRCVVVVAWAVGFAYFLRRAHKTNS